LRDVTYTLDEVAIGSGLNAAAYSYISSVPLIINRSKSPFEHEYLSPKVALSKVGLNNIPSTLKTPTGEHEVGLSEFDAWRYVVYMLSLGGLCSLADRTESIRIQGEQVVVTSSSSRVLRINFKKLLIFDPEGVEGLSEAVKIHDRVSVYDWINVRSGMVHDYDRIESSSDFVKYIHFYPSDRVDGNHDRKDLVAVSNMSEEDLKDYRYSDTYVRFKVKEMMKVSGIKGKKNGFDYKGDQKFVDVKLEPSRREVRRDGQNHYEDTESIKFIKKTAEEIIEETEQARVETYLSRLKEIINGERED